MHIRQIQNYTSMYSVSPLRIPLVSLSQFQVQVHYTFDLFGLFEHLYLWPVHLKALRNGGVFFLCQGPAFSAGAARILQTDVHGVRVFVTVLAGLHFAAEFEVGGVVGVADELEHGVAEGRVSAKSIHRN